MKKMKHGGKVHKRMMDGGKVMDPSLAAAMAANPANAPVRGAGPIRGAAPVGGREMPMRGGRKMMDRPGIGRGMPMRGAKGPMVRPGAPSGPLTRDPAGMTKADYIASGKPLPPRPSAAEGKPAFSPNVSYSQPPGATKPTPRTQDFAGLSSLEKATGQSMADFRQRQAAQNAAIIGNSTGSKPVGGAPGQLPGTVGGAPIIQQAATQQAATQSGVGTPFSKPSFFKKGGAVKSKAMRGGGLARKGVGMALAKGGLARRAGGCAKRGVGRGRMV